MRMCLSHLVVIFVFSISDESSTCHLPAQLPLPHCSQQVLFYTISDSFTSLRSNNILQSDVAADKTLNHFIYLPCCGSSAETLED